MRKISMYELMDGIDRLSKEKKRKCTLLGIGPMSRPVIEASLLAAKESDFPVMFIASRNQIDAYEFGGGYVCGWNQKDFVREISLIAEKIGFEGLYYICRDHGGPWQRDAERKDALPEDEAMEIAKSSYVEDLVSGFDLLHIDPTKDPHCSGVIPLDTVISRSVELIAHVESERIRRELPPVAYEVGTEETNGGLTSIGAFEDFIRKLNAETSGRGLPDPLFIVGQTGTLTRLTENVGHFDAEAGMKLAQAAARYGTGLKEHNADYLSDQTLLIHPYLGITAANVAPEFGVEETKTYLLLNRVEESLYKQSVIDRCSDFRAVIARQTVISGKWKKWMTPDKTALSTEDILSDTGLTSLITETAGHYTFEDPDVKEAKEKMFRNLSVAGMDPDSVVLYKLKNSIRRYAECFNMTGLTKELSALFSLSFPV